jgi:hypothetical protein
VTTFLDRLLGRPEPPRSAKAVTSLGGWANAIPLSSYANTPQQRAAAYLKAYKVGWFSKAGRWTPSASSCASWKPRIGHRTARC